MKATQLLHDEGIIPQLESTAAPRLSHNTSTNALISRYRQAKEIAS